METDIVVEIQSLRKQDRDLFLLQCRWLTRREGPFWVIVAGG